MRIIPNIIPAIKFFINSRIGTRAFGDIRVAREAGDYDKEREIIRRCTNEWGRRVLSDFGSNLHIIGYDNIPDEGPVVFMGNHQGFADIFSYYAAIDKFQFGFIAKEELSDLPIFGKMMNEVRCIFIKRSNSRASLVAINEGIEYIKQGFSMAIFPEGTRSSGGEIKPFMRGAIKLATVPGVPVIPVSLEGSYRMLEEKGYFTGGEIYIKFHPPIETAGIDKKEEKTLINHIEQIVRDGVEDLKALDRASK